MIILTLALLISTPSFAAENDKPACGQILVGPTIAQLRQKYFGVAGPEPEMRPYDGQTYEGAHFVLDAPGGFKLRFAEYPGVEFAWDSANDNLRFRIIKWLGPLREAGGVTAPAPGLTGKFDHAGPGSSTFQLDSVELPR